MSAAEGAKPAGPGPAAAAPKHERDIYFVSPVVDFLVAGGGLSMLLFAVLGICKFFGIHAGERTPLVWGLGFWLSFIINYPHFAATSMRLYQSYDRMMQFPKTAFLSPVVVVLGLVFALQNADFAPWYVKLFLVWSGYHYSGQTKGIALLYARRLGVEIDPLTRALIVIPTYGSWLYLIVSGETSQNGIWTEFMGLKIPTGLPIIASGASLPYEPFMKLSNAIFYLTVITFGLLILITLIRKRSSFPIAACAPVGAQILWYLPGLSNKVGLLSFSEFIPLFHSLQYMIVAWAFQLKEQSAEPGYAPSTDSVIWESAKWFIFIGIGGALLFFFIPRGLELRGYPGPNGLAEAAFIAAVQIHHFFVDGVIWKIRDPRTRSMLSGNVFDLAGMPRTA